jgi:hypothetical protein
MAIVNYEDVEEVCVLEGLSLFINYMEDGSKYCIVSKCSLSQVIYCGF